MSPKNTKISFSLQIMIGGNANDMIEMTLRVVVK
jgi:hypothetical protein